MEFFNCIKEFLVVCFVENVFLFVLFIVVEFCLVFIGFFFWIWLIVRKIMIRIFFMNFIDLWEELMFFMN